MSERLGPSIMSENANPEQPQRGGVVTTGHTPDAATVRHTPDAATVGRGVDTSTEAQSLVDQIAAEYAPRPIRQPLLTRRQTIAGALGTALSATAIGALLLRKPDGRPATPTPGPAAGGVSGGERSTPTPRSTATTASSTETPTLAPQVISGNPTREATDVPPPPAGKTTPQIVPTEIATLPPTKTIDQATGTPTLSETERRKNFTHTIGFDGEKVGMGKREYGPNPYFPNAEKALFDLAMKAHEVGFLANNPEEAAKVDKTDPRWYEKLVFSGGGQYTISGFKKQTFVGDQDHEDVLIQPMHGIRGEIVVNNKLLSRSDNLIRPGVIFDRDRQAYMLVDEKGALTQQTVLSESCLTGDSVLPYIDKWGAETWVVAAYLHPTYAALGNVALLRGATTVVMKKEEKQPFQDLLIKELPAGTPIQKPYTFIDDNKKIRATAVVFK